MGLRYDKIIVIDLEAQCWKGKPPKNFDKDIIEIGIASVDLCTLKAEREEAILIKPKKCQISPFCTELTSITQEMIDEHGIPLGRACRRIMEKYSGRKRIWGSWGNYDKDHMQSECCRDNVKYPFSDTHWNIKSMIVPILGWDREYGLDNALKEMELPFEGVRHRGVDDAYNTAIILAEVLKRSR